MKIFTTKVTKGHGGKQVTVTFKVTVTYGLAQP